MRKKTPPKFNSLAELFASFADIHVMTEASARDEQARLVALIADGTDWSVILRHAKELAAIAGREIKRGNSTKDISRAIEDCMKRTGGVHPTKFYYLTVMNELYLGGTRKGSQARRLALQEMRPDLFDAVEGTRDEVIAKDEAARILKQMKNWLDKPPAALLTTLDMITQTANDHYQSVQANG